jgi:hypothetical protein
VPFPSVIIHSGVSHTAEVSAESLFEAAVLGVKAISQEWGQKPALMTSSEWR